jgi:membrane protease YdiL (CAAX protease family)
MMQFPPPTTAPAGWYPDPDGSGSPRWFDGRRWLPLGVSPVTPAGTPLGTSGSTGPLGAPTHSGTGPVPTLAPARPPHPTLPPGTAVGAILVLAGSLLGARLVVDLLVDRSWPLLAYVVILMVLGYGPSVWWSLRIARRHGGGAPASAVGFRFRWSDLGWGPLIWFAAVLSQVLVAAVVLAAGVPTSSNTDGVGELSADRSYVIALAVTAVVAAPLVEELVFRGVVLRSLLSWAAPIPAILLQGVLFGIAHVDPVRGSGNVGLVAILSGVGIALGAGAYLLRRIGPTVVAHAIFNGVVLAIILSGVTDRFEIG